MFHARKNLHLLLDSKELRKIIYRFTCAAKKKERAIKYPQSRNTEALEALWDILGLGYANVDARFIDNGAVLHFTFFMKQCNFH